MNDAAQNQQVAQQDERRPVVTPRDLQEFFLRHIDSVKAVAAKNINPDRMVRIVTAAATKSPLLVKCDPLTTLRSVAKSAELGLEIEGGLGEAHLVPYWNKKRRCYEAQFIPGFRGLVKLAKRSGEVSKVEAHVVRDGDEFSFEFGTAQQLTHRPALKGEDRTAIAYYAIAFMREGEAQFDVMTRAEVEAIKDRSKAKDNGPWVTDFDEMGRKTVVRRLCKYLPQSIELAQALEAQAHAEAGTFAIEAEDAAAAAALMPRAKDDPAARAPEADSEPLRPAPAPPEAERETVCISAGTAKTIRARISSSSIDEAGFCEFFDIKAIADLPADKAERAMEWLKDQGAAA